MLILLCLSLLTWDSEAITKISLVDHNDPNYTDRCLEITGELCDYCCLTDFEWCSRDIYACEPVRDRNLSAMNDCLLTLTGVILGFPLLGCILYHCMMVRFCGSCYVNTGGITCFECVCRALYFGMCCGRRFSHTYQLKEEDGNEGNLSGAQE